MPSSADRNLISIIAMAQGAALSIRQQRGDNIARTLFVMLEKIDSACNRAFEMLAIPLPQRECNRIVATLTEFQAKNCPDAKDVSILTSFILGLLSDALDALKDPWKRLAVEGVERSVWRLHVYYDKKLGRWGAYAVAGEMIQAWGRMAAA